jgi:hypothetical protein
VQRGRGGETWKIKLIYIGATDRADSVTVGQVS